MSGEEKVLTLDPEEHGLLVNGLNHFRNECLREGKPTEDVEDLLLKAIDAPPKKKRGWLEREGR